MSDTAADILSQAKSKYQAGELADAADLYQRVLSRDPTHADALHMLGVIAYQLGQVDAAAALLEQAISVRQPFAEAETNFGTVLMALGRLAEAEQMLQTAHEHAPDNPTILFNLGNACFDQDKTENAQTAYQSAVELKPDYAEAWCQLGIIRSNRGDLAEAMAAYENAIDANPKFSQALYNLANVYRDLDRFGDAEQTLRKAIGVRPEYAMAWNSLGTLLGDMGRSREAVEAFDQAVLFAPESKPYASNRLCALQYVEEINDEDLAAAHMEWYWLHIAPDVDAGPPPFRSRDPDRPLRVGFVSPDFGFHPVGFLTAPVFDHLDSDDIETFVFSTRPEAIDDAFSHRIQAACDHWLPSSDLNDQALAELVEEHLIDILFDMSGQTSANQLGVFARKPAPIQISWIGYVGSTGLPAMDYILSDQHQSPENTDATYVEKALRLPDGYACYAAPEYASDVEPLPALRNGHVTFGVLNNPGKLNSAVIKSLAAIVKGTPDSKILFRFRGLDDEASQRPIQKELEKQGVDADRVVFRGRGSHEAFLATYNQIDIAIDTFPYSGGLTTCEALWMGVPTVTFPGITFAGRHAATHLHAAGYPDLVAGNRDQMVVKALDLARDKDALAALRADMRNRVRTSALCDGPKFAANFAATLRSTWKEWCDSSPQ